MPAPKKVTTKKKVFILTFKTDVDPTLTFPSLEKAKEFVSCIFTDDEDKADTISPEYAEASGNGEYNLSDIEKDSLKLYEGVLVGKAHTDVTFK